MKVQAAVILSCLVTALAAPALAEDLVAQCIAANERSLTLRKQSMLNEAREESLKCAAATCPDQIRTACTQRIADIASVMPSVVFQVKDSKNGDVVEVNVEVDGKPATKLGLSALTLNPGKHTLHFSAESFGVADTTILLREGEKNRQERVALNPSSTSASVTTPPTNESHTTDTPPPTQEAPTTPGQGQRMAGIVVGGVGVVGIVVGSVFGGLAISKWNSAKADCGAWCGPSAPAQDEKATASTDGTISTVAFIAGGVALAAGIVLFVTAPRKKATDAAWIGVVSGPGSTSLMGRF